MSLSFRPMARRAAGAPLLLSVSMACAWAQDASPGRVPALDSIVVSGERIDRSLQRTAASVTSLDAEAIERRIDAASVADVIKGTPNLIFPDTVGAPVIRGQDTQGPNFGASAFLGGTIPRATVNVDGRYLSYYELVFGAASIWDVNGIEVFRGPQTSTQGANSIAGAVIVKTKDPTFHPEGAAQALIGSGNLRRGSVMVSGPLIEDQLAARLMVDYSGRDTFIDYVNPGFARGDSDQNFRSLSTRMKLLWLPDALPGLEAKLTFAHTQHNRPTSEAASTPYGDYESRTASMPSFRQRANTIIGDVSYELGGGVRLFNRSEFTDLSVRRITEPPSNGGADIEQRNVSNETRINWGTEASDWSGVAGLFYNRTDSDDRLTIRGVSQFDDGKRNLGLYAEINRRLAERWRLTTGLRYQRDHVRRHGTTPYARTPMAYDQTFSAVLPKVSLAYDLTPQVTVGALISKGYNPGGVGLSFAQARIVPFDEETVWNYELFGRASLLDGRMNLTGNLFYSDFRDSQRLLPDYLNGVLYGAIVVNAEKARSYGLELAMDHQVLDSLRLKSGVGLLHTRIDRFSDGSGVLEGKRFGRAPSYTLSLGAQWRATARLTLDVDVRHTAGYHSTDENIAAYEVDPRTVAGARLSYAVNKHTEVFAYVDNLFDDRSPTWFFDDRTVRGIAGSMPPPREFGAGVRITF